MLVVAAAAFAENRTYRLYSVRRRQQDFFNRCKCKIIFVIINLYCDSFTGDCIADEHHDSLSFRQAETTVSGTGNLHRYGCITLYQ